MTRLLQLRTATLLVLATIAGIVGVQADSPRSFARLEKSIWHELVMLPFYGVFDNLAFRIDGDRVTLLGQVTRPTLKTDAARVLKGIEGIEGVDNQIEVLPLSSNDDRIRLALYRALYGHNSLYRYAIMAIPSIHIIVKNGDVTLEGAAATKADKDIASLQANGVTGVFSVQNNLRVDASMDSGK